MFGGFSPEAPDYPRAADMVITDEGLRDAHPLKANLSTRPRSTPAIVRSVIVVRRWASDVPRPAPTRGIVVARPAQRLPPSREPAVHPLYVRFDQARASSTAPAATQTSPDARSCSTSQAERLVAADPSIQIARRSYVVDPLANGATFTEGVLSDFSQVVDQFGNTFHGADRIPAR